ncbi:unnamed protein product [Rodentolepis nana]|uniref:Homeobox domain-containing protein n=1 Tax=Rodentolepis nana TaxID=102285 RepID=A0A0R3TMC5_RODNA|nr:unnamed protein product [Rodentolepis nana]
MTDQKAYLHHMNPLADIDVVDTLAKKNTDFAMHGPPGENSRPYQRKSKLEQRRNSGQWKLIRREFKTSRCNELELEQMRTKGKQWTVALSRSEENSRSQGATNLNNKRETVDSGTLRHSRLAKNQKQWTVALFDIAKEKQWTVALSDIAPRRNSGQWHSPT